MGLGFHTTIPFTVGCDGVYAFWFHGDYGRGGYVGVDEGRKLHSVTGDLWGYFNLPGLALTPGAHTFGALGFEGCCDGWSLVEVRLPGKALGGWAPVVSGASAALVSDSCNGDCASTKCDLTLATPACRALTPADTILQQRRQGRPRDRCQLRRLRLPGRGQHVRAHRDLPRGRRLHGRPVPRHGALG